MSDESEEGLALMGTPHKPPDAPPKGARAKRRKSKRKRRQGHFNPDSAGWSASVPPVQEHSSELQGWSAGVPDNMRALDIMNSRPDTSQVPQAVDIMDSRPDTSQEPKYIPVGSTGMINSNYRLALGGSEAPPDPVAKAQVLDHERVAMQERRKARGRQGPKFRQPSTVSSLTTAQEQRSGEKPKEEEEAYMMEGPLGLVSGLGGIVSRDGRPREQARRQDRHAAEVHDASNAAPGLDVSDGPRDAAESSEPLPPGANEPVFLMGTLQEWLPWTSSLPPADCAPLGGIQRGSHTSPTNKATEGIHMSTGRPEKSFNGGPMNAKELLAISTARYEKQQEAKPNGIAKNAPRAAQKLAVALQQFSHWSLGLPSIGTAKHLLPETQCEPCAKYLSGFCKKGANCAKCHDASHKGPMFMSL